MKRKAFTLIELLIVIALLGALAIGLLAALDPFEQLKKGNDTGVRNTVSEIHGAIVRYYAIRSTMPYASPLSQVDAETGFTTIGIDKVITAGELKNDFSALAGAKLQSITVQGASESVTVCFKPESRSFRSDVNTKYVINGTDFSETTNDSAGANCGLPSSTSFSCYWCVK